MPSYGCTAVAECLTMGEQYQGSITPLTALRRAFDRPECPRGVAGPGRGNCMHTAIMGGFHAGLWTVCTGRGCKLEQAGSACICLWSHIYCSSASFLLTGVPLFARALLYRHIFIAKVSYGSGCGHLREGGADCCLGPARPMHGEGVAGQDRASQPLDDDETWGSEAPLEVEGRVCSCHSRAIRAPEGFQGSTEGFQRSTASPRQAAIRPPEVDYTPKGWPRQGGWLPRPPQPLHAHTAAQACQG